MTKSLTEGKPLKLVLQFSAPILLSMLFQQFYNLVDTMIVGRILGENALAAVSSTSSINFMIIGFCMGVCSGFAIPMAQAFGAQEPHELRRYIGSCVWLCVIFSAVLAISTGLLCTQILRWMGTPEEILADAAAYIGILFWGIPVTYLYNMTSSMLRAVGDSRTPVVFLGLAAGLNISRGEVDAFRDALAEYYRENRPAAAPEVHCDLLISDPAMLSIDSVRSLDQLEPYGNANPRPTLCVFGAELESADAVGGGRHLRMRVRLGKERFEAIFFSHTAAELGLRAGELVDLAFTPQINEFRGHVSVQFVVSEARPHDSAELCAAILAGEEQSLYAAAPFCPDRADFVRIWRDIQRRGFTAAGAAAGIIAQTPRGMEPERFCICLMVLLEVGLLSPGSGGGIFGAVPHPIAGKADLEGTRLIRLLRSM